MVKKLVALVVIMAFLLIAVGYGATRDPITKEGEYKLTRIPEKGVLGGVAAGMAYYFGVDVTTIRVGWVVFTLMGGAGVLAYIIMWILVPKASFVPSDYDRRS